MELEDLIELYVYNPKDELKKIITEKIKDTSRISLIAIIDTINKKIADESEVKYNYNEVRKILLEEIKKENGKNYTIDETGRPVEIIEKDTVKSSKIR